MSFRRISRKCNMCENFVPKNRKLPFCSVECFFDSNVMARPVDISQCWTWTGRTHKFGYGFMTYGIKQTAHSFSYKRFCGEVPKGMVVRHKCQTRNCISPNHLELGTIGENMKDKIRDGTSGKGQIAPHKYGSRNPIAKIDEKTALEIFQFNKNINETAKHFNITKGIVYRIKTGISWWYVTGLPRCYIKPKASVNIKNQAI